MTRKTDDGSLQALYALHIKHPARRGQTRVDHASRATLSALALALVLGGVAGRAATSDTPYQSIVERNVFGLKPPPPPPDPETLKPPPSKITLTGIMTIFGKKQALMKTPPSPAPPAKPGQPPDPPKEHSYMLAEGQGEDGITVLQIDTEAKTVKVDNGGHIETLMFSTNAPAASAANSGVPTPAGFGSGTPAPGFPRTIPRPLRIPSPGAAASPYGGASGNSGLGTGAETTPNGVGAGGVGQGVQPMPEQQPASIQRSPEEAALLAEASRLKNEQLRQSGALRPPIPQHPLLQGYTGDAAEGQPPAQSRGIQYPVRPGMPQLPQ